MVDLAGSKLSLQQFTSDLVRQVCDRDSGVGADGVVLLDFSKDTTRMTIINSDGSPSGMCGNALRCVAQVLSRRSGRASRLVSIGDRLVETSVDEEGVAGVVIGPPEGLEGRAPLDSVPELDATVGRGYLLWFGNPHNVVPVARIPDDWVDRGEKVQEIADRNLGTGGINCGFLEQEPTEGVHRLRVFERGAGVTQSCGSGACAASAVLENVLGIEPPHRLALLGGILTVGRGPGGFTLSGPARLEFEGEWS